MFCSLFRVVRSRNKIQGIDFGMFQRIQFDVNILRTNSLIHRKFGSGFEPKFLLAFRRFNVNMFSFFFPRKEEKPESLVLLYRQTHLVDFVFHEQTTPPKF